MIKTFAEIMLLYPSFVSCFFLFRLAFAAILSYFPPEQNTEQSPNKKQNDKTKNSQKDCNFNLF